MPVNVIINLASNLSYIRAYLIECVAGAAATVRLELFLHGDYCANHPQQPCQQRCRDADADSDQPRDFCWGHKALSAGYITAIISSVNPSDLACAIAAA